MGALQCASAAILVHRRERVYTFDPSGNLAQRLDASANVLGTYAFDAFGLRTGTDSTTDPYAGFEGGWGYYADAETGLSLLGHRYYDTGTGRFINRDPIGYDGGSNLYAYVDNNPVDAVDPNGTDKFKINNSDHKSTSQNADDVFAHLSGPTPTYDHQNYIIDVPNNQNLDRNLADARRFKRLLEDSGLNYFDQLAMKHSYLDHFCGNNGVGDYGKNLTLYPDSDPNKNNSLYWQRRLGANYNLGIMGGALGFSEESLLLSGHTLSLKHFAGLHGQTEQDAIEDGFSYQSKH